MTHQVRGAWYPNWIGHDQIRHFKFDGSRLLLSTPPLIWDGQSFEYVLTWERISCGPHFIPAGRLSRVFGPTPKAEKTLAALPAPS